MPLKNRDAVWQSLVAATISLGISYLAYSAGFLPDFERKFHARASRVRPAEVPTVKMVIVGLTDRDIETLGFPVTDEILADLLDKIEGQNPRVIGLDLHRNIDMGERGNQELDEIFTKNQKLIGVEKTNGGVLSFNSIPPPIQLELAGRTGASEIIKDADRIVRRAYLYTQKAEEGKSEITSVPSLGLAVALKYLEGAKLVRKEESFKGWLRRNQAIFPRLNQSDFFYPRKELDAYQILIEHLPPQEIFQTVSFADVLEGNIPSSLMEDKIVLIGSTAESVKDIYMTPYPATATRRFIYGVELHGIITHQIVAAALKERKIISFPSLSLQYLWLGVWLLSIALASGQLCLTAQTKRQEINCLFLGISSSIIIIISGYGLLLARWVVPTVTTLLLLVSYQIIIYIFLRFNQLSSAKALLLEEVERKTQALKQAQNLILEQEKFNVHQKVIYYIAHEIINKINSVQLQLEDSQYYLDKLKLFIQNNLDLFDDEEEDSDSTPQIVNRLENKILELLRLNEEITEIIENIYQKTERIERVKTKTNLNKLLTKIATEIVELKERNINNLQVVVEQNYAENLLEIDCIVPELERAFEKIIENAVYQIIQKYQDARYIDARPTITLTTINQSDSVLIKIKDNGPGIKAELKEKIFESFWSTKPSGEGMGLGLYIAKEIIAGHGGEILVDSEPGEWTEFTIILPR